MNYNATGIKGLRAIDSSGTLVAPDNTGTVTLGVGTYYFPFGSTLGGAPLETSLLSLNAYWSAALAGAFTIEGCNFDATRSGNGQGSADISDWAATGGAWLQYNPTQVGGTYAAAGGAGNSFTALALTLGGTAVGSALINMPDFGFRRARAKIVTTVGGTIRLMPWGKLGA